MPIVFNIYALLQAIVGLACLGILQLVTNLFNYDYDLFGGSGELPFSLQFLALVTAYTDSKGIKGRLFYLPTWIALLLGSALAFYAVAASVLDDPGKTKTILYCSAAVITLFYFWQSRRDLQKTWAKKKSALEALLAIPKKVPMNKEYWKLASHVYYKPSFLFLEAYPLWKFLFGKVIDPDEFLEYYRSFVNSIPTDELWDDKYKSWIDELKNALNAADNYAAYVHPANSFNNLAHIINEINERYK